MAALPYADILSITGPGPILILAPHPDDESLGCGGLIAQAHAAGIEVHVAILTDGAKSHPKSADYPAVRLIALREAEAEAAVATLGLPAGRVTFMRYPDAAAPRYGHGLREAGEQLATLVRRGKIGTIFASWRHDPHCDHLAAHRIASLACRIGGLRHISYAVWGWTLDPALRLPGTRIDGWRLDVTTSLSMKRRAIACHRSQLPGLITDDPGGFTIPDALRDLCDRPFESYLRLRG